MLEAFRLGGDFHSRTAASMFPNIQREIDAGTLLLEAEGPDSKVPLLKDRYAQERKRAKILNFSLAYGKTAHGLADDFGVTKTEAKKIIERWYAARPEVKQWQKVQEQRALDHGYTRTLLGRFRFLDMTPQLRSHALRCAINTPIQGGAADIVMAAMLKLERDPEFKALGWRQILQVHDEIVCEGPSGNAQQAMQRVRAAMERPFDEPLLVDLVVDAKIASNWHEAK